MKQFVAVLAFIALASAGYIGNRGQSNIKNPNNDIPIVRFESVNNVEGGYNYAYETGDRTSAQEQGHFKDADTLAAQGSYSFVAPDGQQFSITYTADENGYVAQGAHIPIAPPIPQEILEGLEQNKADEARGIFDDGQYHPEPAPQQQYKAQRNNAPKRFY